MKNQIKTALGSAFAVATLILITTGGSVAQEKGCINCMCNRPQQPNNLPQQPNSAPQQPNSVASPFSQPGYIRGK
jgi:hypothetical protein